MKGLPTLGGRLMPEDGVGGVEDERRDPLTGVTCEASLR